jgi:hypothetical protein
MKSLLDHINALILGQEYYVRIAANNLQGLVGPYPSFGYPNTAASIAPKSPPTVVTLSAFSETGVRVDSLPPPNLYLEGSNESPINSHVKEIATARMETQEISIESTGEIIRGGFKLELLGSQTGCVNIHDSNNVMERELESLEYVPFASITISYFACSNS